MEKRDPGEPEDVIMQQYPSPGAEGHDAGPYYTSARDPAQAEADHQQHQEPEPSPHHQHRVSSAVSAEELQLAAQLTQGLAPMMAGTNPNEDPSLHGVMQHADHHAHDYISDNLEEQLQEHLSEPGNGAEHISENEHTQDRVSEHIADHVAEDIVEHIAERPPEHALEHTQQHGNGHIAAGAAPPPPPPPPPPHLPVQQVQMHQLSPHYGMAADSTPPRKRSKVSRACDECRRKKVKCDAASESSEEPCSNCRRSQIQCLFSRVPQKRGPSKGYIKELADRINSIEGKLASEGGTIDGLELANAARRASAEIFSPSLQQDESRKRPYSSISSDFQSPVTGRLAAWGSEQRPQTQETPDRTRRPVTANDLAPRPRSPVSDLSVAPRPEAVMHGLPELQPADHDFHLNDEAYQAYQVIIHPVFPILAGNRAKVETTVRQCPSALRVAFIEAFHAAVQAYAPMPGVPSGDYRQANRSLTEWELQPGPQSPTMALVNLQVVLLLALELNGRGPSAFDGIRHGPTMTSLLGKALGLAHARKLYRSTVQDVSEFGADPDSDRKVSIRAWLALVTLDRWNALSLGEQMLIPQESVVLGAGVSSVMSAGQYEFFELTDLLVDFIGWVAEPLEGQPRQTTLAVCTSVHRAVEKWRRQFVLEDKSDAQSFTHFAYWHVRLFAYLLMPNVLNANVLWAASQCAKALIDHSGKVTPLNHHFTALTVLALVELSNVEESCEEANKNLQAILTNNIAPSAWDTVIREQIGVVKRPTTSTSLMPSSVEATASQSLQHLADLATATEVQVPDAVKFDRLVEIPKSGRSHDYVDLGFNPRAMLMKGYLNAFGGEVSEG